MKESLQLVCPSCAVLNRLPLERLAEAPKCGKCGSLLFSSRPVDLAETDFDRFLAKSDLPVLVDFWAPWCAPCKMMAPQFAEAAAELAPRVLLAKVNTEAEQALGGRYGIRSIPTMVLFEGGREKARHSGAINRSEIVNWANQNVA